MSMVTMEEVMAALVGHLAEGEALTLYSHVPEGGAPPYRVIDALELDRPSAWGSGLRECRMRCSVYGAAESPRAVLALAEQLAEALEQAEVALEEGYVRGESASTQLMPENGGRIRRAEVIWKGWVG